MPIWTNGVAADGFPILVAGLYDCPKCPCDITSSSSSSSSSSEVQRCPNYITVALFRLIESPDNCIDGHIGTFTLELVDYSYDGYTVYATYRHEDSDGNYVDAVTYWEDGELNTISSVTFSMPFDNGSCFICKNESAMCIYGNSYGALLLTDGAL